MMSKKRSAEKTVRDIRRATRRQYSAEEKIRIVLEGLRGEDSIAELCRREGINSNEALLRLENDEARERVKTTETFWHSLGVSSVPTMVFNRSSALTGAQSVEVYKQVLTELLTTENTKA